MLKAQGRGIVPGQRRWFLPSEAFSVSSGYDTAIFNYFDREEGSLGPACGPSTLPSTCAMARIPHQQDTSSAISRKCSHSLHGKEISYNNLA